MPAINSLRGYDFEKITERVFLFSGTYYPSSGTKFCVVEMWGGGGGGGASNDVSDSGVGSGPATGGGGAGGNYSRRVWTAAEIGASKSFVIGAGGAGGFAAGASGGSGGQTTMGPSTQYANGGGGGSSAKSPEVVLVSAAGGLPGAKSGGTFNLLGGRGGSSTLGTFYKSGDGGASPFNAFLPAIYLYGLIQVGGISAENNSGVGGTGAVSKRLSTTGATWMPGGNGGSGLILITEYGLI